MEACTLREAPPQFVCIANGHYESLHCFVAEHSPDKALVQPVKFTDNQSRVVELLFRGTLFKIIFCQFAAVAFDLAITVARSGEKERPARPDEIVEEQPQAVTVGTTLERAEIQYVSIRGGSRNPLDVRVTEVRGARGRGVGVNPAGIHMDVLGVIKNTPCLRGILTAYAQAGFALGLEVFKHSKADDGA